MASAHVPGRSLDETTRTTPVNGPPTRFETHTHSCGSQKYASRRGSGATGRVNSGLEKRPFCWYADTTWVPRWTRRHLTEKHERIRRLNGECGFEAELCTPGSRPTLERP
jgi:hypothetical protein